MSSRNATDRISESLLEAAQRGEEKALLALLEFAQPDIRRFDRSTCHVSDIHDAVQESLWLLYRKVGGVRTLGALTSWLFTVVKRECLRLMRRGARGTETGIESIEDDLRFSELPTEDLRLDLARALQELPDHYREMVLQVDVQETPIGEVAQALSLTRESAKARLHRARLQIRKSLLR